MELDGLVQDGWAGAGGVADRAGGGALVSPRLAATPWVGLVVDRSGGRRCSAGRPGRVTSPWAPGPCSPCGRGRRRSARGSALAAFCDVVDAATTVATGGACPRPGGCWSARRRPARPSWGLRRWRHRTVERSVPGERGRPDRRRLRRPARRGQQRRAPEPRPDADEAAGRELRHAGPAQLLLRLRQRLARPAGRPRAAGGRRSSAARSRRPGPAAGTPRAGSTRGRGTSRRGRAARRPRTPRTARSRTPRARRCAGRSASCSMS